MADDVHILHIVDALANLAAKQFGSTGGPNAITGQKVHGAKDEDGRITVFAGLDENVRFGDLEVTGELIWAGLEVETLNEGFLRSILEADNPVIDTDGNGATPDPNGFKRGSAKAGASQYITDVYKAQLELNGLSMANVGRVCSSGDFIFVTNSTTLSKIEKKTMTVVDTVDTTEITEDLDCNSTHIVCSGDSTFRVFTIASLTETANGSFGTGTTTRRIVIDDTHFYASDPGNTRYQKYLIDGTFVGNVSYAGNNVLGDLAIDSTYLYISQYYDNTVKRYNKSSGAFVDSTAVTEPLSMGIINSQLYILSEGDPAPSGGSFVVLDSSMAEVSTFDLTSLVDDFFLTSNSIFYATTAKIYESILPGLCVDNAAQASIDRASIIKWLSADSADYIGPEDIEANAAAIAAIDTNFFNKTLDTSDNLTQGSTKLLLTVAERAAIAALLTGFNTVQAVATATANVAATAGVVDIDVDTIAADATLTILTAGIVDGRRIKFIARGGADLYNVSIVCEGGEFFNGTFDTYLMDKENQTASFLCIDGGLILERN